MKEHSDYHGLRRPSQGRRCLWHGHFAHVCRMSRKSLGPRPDLPIRVEKIGGGAAPEGYGAFVWPDELHVTALTYADYDGQHPVEDFLEEHCYDSALVALIANGTLRSWARGLHNDLNPFLSGRDKLEIQFQVLDLAKRVDAHLLPD